MNKGVWKILLISGYMECFSIKNNFLIEYMIVFVTVIAIPVGKYFFMLIEYCE